MSTYKVQPVYAELVFGWLDLATCWDSQITPRDVARVVSWNFRGGEMGNYNMQYPSEYMPAEYPDGPLADQLNEHGEVRPALASVLGRRRAGGARTMRSRSDWATSYSLCAEAVHEVRMSMGEMSPATTGLRAAYRLVSWIWADLVPGETPRSWASYCSYIRESALGSAAASRLDVPSAADAWDRAQRALCKTRVGGLLSALDEFDRAMRYTGSSAARLRARAIGREILAGAAPELDILPRYRVGSAVMRATHGCLVGTRGTETLALSRSDLVRVHQMLSAIMSGVFATCVQSALSPGSESMRAAQAGAAYEAQVGRILCAVDSTPQGDEVHVCKGFKRAFTYWLGVLSGPLGRAEAQALWAETLDTRHIPRVLLEEWVRECRGWPAGTSFNIGKAYKLCPAPDACPARTLLERHEMVCNRNTAADPAVHELGIILRDQILRAYIRKPGVRLGLRAGTAKPAWFDDYEAGRTDMVPTAAIHTFLEWEGTAVMPERMPDDPAVWKDSGLGWDTLELAMADEKPRFWSNMMTRMMVDNSAPMPGTRHMAATHPHKIDTKPEGYKDPARGIYSGNLSDRLDQSWMEQAVEEIAHHHPSFMIGADVATREARIRAIVDRTVDPRYQDVYYSFDIAGWSPRMDPKIQRVSHAVWATLYGEPLFEWAHNINEAGVVYMNKAGYAGWFRNTGANFEGYNGKEMTMVLVALMARAVGKWRDTVVASHLATPREVAKWAAVLLAYIDDGLAKITLPRERAAALFEHYKAATVASFAECGFTIEVSKCFPSDRFAIFLNEPYLAGRHVVHGTRAAMTICAENTEPHTSLLERVTSVSTGCRGAVTAGLDPMVGTMLQAFHVFRHMREWVHQPNPVLAAVWSFAPRNWGGLGLTTALQLGTSGGGSAFEEGVQTLQAWAQVSLPARAFFLNSCRATLSDRSPMGIVSSPLGGRLADGPMIESRVPDAVRDGLRKLVSAGRLSRLATSFLKYASPESMSEFSARVLSADAPIVIQEQVLRDIASIHPHALFSAFARRIEKSSTLIMLVGQREMARIIRANRSDAAASYAALKVRAITH